MKLLFSGVAWTPKNELVFDKNVRDWLKKFDKLENVKIEHLPGDHHFFVESKNAAKVAASIHSFISSDNK